ncbi:hypothetical protein KCU85_g4715, partial [Aureobasidium melanogenum]
MAHLTDLPPEVRLKIYNLLLDDPIRDGLRITMTFDPLDDNKITWGRARCAQTEKPHKQGHSADPCCVDVPPFTLHHLDFTDLWSLARISKQFYLEATPTIYNNADLTYSVGELPSAAKPLKVAPASNPLRRFLERHSPVTRAMFRTLVIRDNPIAMSPRAMKLLVDIVNSHLPNLRVFGYQISTDVSKSFIENFRDSCRSIFRMPRTMQPLAQLKHTTRTFLELPIPAELESVNLKMYQTIAGVRNLLCGYAMDTVTHKVQGRHASRRYHEIALEFGVYLYITSALRSESARKKEVGKVAACMEEMAKGLVDLHMLANCQYVHRSIQKLARTIK